MLSWISGPRLGEEPKEEDNVSVYEPPETPAPVFAVRAFKHALFGTPEPVETNQGIANSEDEYEGATAERDHRPLHQGKRASFPGTDLEARDGAPSPAKPTSILMTPGTGVARRKTVSFGTQVADNEGKRSMAQGRSGLPSDFPGKFPSPWTPKTTEKAVGQRTQSGRGRATKLTKTLHNIRESSQSGNESRCADAKTGSIEPNLPETESEQYWKQEYEQYATKTKQEMKKLLTKQKMAKSFARLKDTEVTELAGKLRDERRKVQKLEAKTSELEAQMKQYQDALAKVKDELSAIRQEAAEKTAESEKQSKKQEAAEWQEQQRKSSKELREAREESSSLRIERDNLRKELDGLRRAGARDRRTRNKTDNIGSGLPAVDIWADAMGSTPASVESVRTAIKSSPYKRSHSTTETSPSALGTSDKKYETPPRQKSTSERVKATPPKAIESVDGDRTEHQSHHDSFADSPLPLPEASSPFIHLPKPEESDPAIPPSSPPDDNRMSLPIRSSFPSTTNQPISKRPRTDSVVSKKEATKKENIRPQHTAVHAGNNNKHNTGPNAHATNDNLQVPATRPSTQIKTSTKENAVPQNTLARLSPGAPVATEGTAVGERKTSLLSRSGMREISFERREAAQKRLEERKKAREIESSRPKSFR
ncbi:MAG: hypothetical protein M1821_009015 [Bathelium mastoideum]|nr:MAG: hypothetical protein M1821_009015 [Bathelium mastoideum]